MEGLDKMNSFFETIGGRKNVVPVGGIFSKGVGRSRADATKFVAIWADLCRHGGDAGAFRCDRGAKCGDTQRMFEQPLVKMVPKQETFIVQVLSVVRGDQVQKYWTTRATHL
ncbi:hypothetical protein Pan161_38040 [Gimesia algae]|uniref:Uncharacterized protein n=1 Tax=Gimesia algae TaxID=2527971 RepID=A0A517VGJ1_9PLAN|nr:hypothetical protein Pan161_38040 [Gimesia algae]